MRTTIDIPDELFRQAKAQAALEGTTLKELVTRGLRLAMEAPDKVDQRATFPILKSQKVGRLDSSEVKRAIQEMGEEDDLNAGVSLRR